MQIPTRADDERDLAFLALAHEGLTPTEIGRAMQTPMKTVSNRLIAIRTADIAHDPDAAAWWHLNHPPRKKGRPAQ
jgi:hypothetical protein